MMENRSFDHFLSWLPDADGRHDMSYLATDGKTYPNYPLAPDFQGCGYSDPDHSWEGFLVQRNSGKMDGWLRTGRNDSFCIGYYEEPDLRLFGTLARPT